MSHLGVSCNNRTAASAAALAEASRVEAVANAYAGPVDDTAMASVLAGMRHAQRIDTRPFVPSETAHFWECDGCKSIPFQFRAKGSVVFNIGEPTMALIEGHLRICNGPAATMVRNAAPAEPFKSNPIPALPTLPTTNPAAPSVKHSYLDTASLPIHNACTTMMMPYTHPVSNNITMQSFAPSSTMMSTTTTLSLGGNAPFNGSNSNKSNDVERGVEEHAMCFPDDKQYTTDFAYFTVTMLKKCYLTKSGGSRGACPVGYPGLACCYCAGKPGERRFFYTSSDHLRNSFSHIPSHMSECPHIPDDVKAHLEQFKTTRNRQKSQLKSGHHKIFIDRVWARLHGAGQGTIPSNNTGGSNMPTSASPTSSLLFQQSMGIVANALIQVSDRNFTSELTYFTLLQVEPYKSLEIDGDDDDETNQIGFPGLVCRHCMHSSNGRKFFTTSAEQLGELLLTIANHMNVCQGCPNDIRSKIASLKPTHESQLQSFTGEHTLCMGRVWDRLVKANATKESRKAKSSKAVAMKTNGPSVQYNAIDQSKPVISIQVCVLTLTFVPWQYITSPSHLINPHLHPCEQESHLVTPYTYFTMAQVRPCNLGHAGNGSRSSFDYGFPGLECIHCAGRNNPRRFFYRTADILAGNYAHIPSHLMTCVWCPQEVKDELEEKKQSHLTQKARLDRGSQRAFFNKVWARLHEGQPQQTAQVADE